jgi:DNA-binding cell septation regulator SpoVG
MSKDEVIVELQPVAGKEKLRARADVLIPLGSAGLVQLLGCSLVEQRGRAPVVFLPSRKGQKDGQYFDCVRLLGPIRQLVTDAVLAEFERAKKSTGKS